MVTVLGILGFIALYFIVSYLITDLVQKLNQIKKNQSSIIEIKKGLNNLNDRIDNIKDVAKLDARLSSLERSLK